MSSIVHQSQAHFDKACDFLFNQLKSTEELSLSLDGESTDYLRFNQSMVRQSTHVDQVYLGLRLQNDKKKMVFDTTLTLNWDQDQATIKALFERARQELESQPEDPFVTAMTNKGSSHKIHSGQLPTHAQAIDEIASLTEDVDFVGLFASGPVIKATANSKGQKHWFSTENFFVDFSLFTQNVEGENKAVKGVYADSKWSQQKLSSQILDAKNKVSLLKRKSKKMNPGSFRVYLAPGAVNEICGIMSWNALSYSAHRSGQCAFSKLADGKVKLSPKFTIKENFTRGLTPQFNSLGEMAPDELVLIQNGELKNMLVSERASKEYGVQSNGAGSGGFGFEQLRAPEILGGQLRESEALQKLGTGLYLSNLHYLNWSDPLQARITGMTRYACFWVENGEVAGPINDMRFDLSLFDLLGADLEDLSQEQHIDPAVSTYFAREVGGKVVPGILANNFKFTL
jgi:predicted Zn-dependent protease